MEGGGKVNAIKHHTPTLPATDKQPEQVEGEEEAHVQDVTPVDTSKVIKSSLEREPSAATAASATAAATPECPSRPQPARSSSQSDCKLRSLPHYIQAAAAVAAAAAAAASAAATAADPGGEGGGGGGAGRGGEVRPRRIPPRCTAATFATRAVPGFVRRQASKRWFGSWCLQPPDGRSTPASGRPASS